jgi:hypothetical protein
MANTSYPTGVENHGGSLRVWFVYKGKESGKTSVSLILPKIARLLVSFVLRFVLR